MSTRIAFVSLLAIAISVVHFEDATAEWGPEGVRICPTANSHQYHARTIPDGSGGMFVVWLDDRDLGPYGYPHVFAQHIDSQGNLTWNPEGVLIYQAFGYHAPDSPSPVLAPVSSGGISIAWCDPSVSEGGVYYEIHVQQLDAYGTAQWGPNGVVVGMGLEPQLTFDDYGSAIVAWFYNVGVYAQKITFGGTPQWEPGGVLLGVGSSYPRMIRDGAGGAIVVWELRNCDDSCYRDIYAQRINGFGDLLWSVDGVAICTAENSQFAPQIVDDGSTGAIISWIDTRNLFGQDIYMQRVSASGTRQWPFNGVPVCTRGGHQSSLQLAADGFGGAIAVWADPGYDIPDSYDDIYAQRMSSGGTPQWEVDGIAVCAAEEAQFEPVLANDGNGGAIIAWTDGRSGGADRSVYAQHIDDEGAPLWAVDGNWISPDDGNHYTSAIVPDGSGGAILVWRPPLVAQHVDDVGCPPTSTLYVDWNATGARTGITWNDAYTSLADALQRATICESISEIWVAGGVYRPTETTDRSASFTMRSGVAIYGGFSGTETDLSQRDWEEHRTTLSGDIGAAGVATDNSYHVVRCSGADATAILDGFIVTGGYGDGTYGGGILISVSDPTLAHMVISDNFASSGGGGVRSSGGNPNFIDVEFTGNETGSDGGGLYIGGGTPTLTNVVFENNVSGRNGGGIYNQGISIRLENVAFVGNVADDNGGAMYSSGPSSGPLPMINVVFMGNSANYGGALYNYHNVPVITNASFTGNLATYTGGGMTNTGGADAILTNIVMWGDEAGSEDDEIHNNSSTPVISHSDIVGCHGSGAEWNASFGSDAGGNFESDPEFKDGDDPDMPLTVWSFSPLIDTGDNAAVPAEVTVDIAGQPRVYNGGTVDIGAYEHQGYPTGVDSNPETPNPRTTRLYRSVPNPFNPSTEIRFELQSQGAAKLAIYDLSGRLVRTLVDETLAAGPHSVTWNGRDSAGRAMPSGSYLMRLETVTGMETMKMTLVQ
jgi:predicted outer membrane repeat protein